MLTFSNFLFGFSFKLPICLTFCYSEFQGFRSLLAKRLFSSLENWLELKIEPPLPNLGFLNRWNTLYNVNLFVKNMLIFHRSSSEWITLFIKSLLKLKQNLPSYSHIFFDNLSFKNVKLSCYFFLPDRSILTTDGDRLIASTIDTFDYDNSYFYSSMPDTLPGKYI